MGMASNGNITNKKFTDYRIKQDLAKQLGGLGHDAATLAAAFITVLGLDEAKGLALYDRVFDHVIKKRESLDG